VSAGIVVVIAAFVIAGGGLGLYWAIRLAPDDGSEQNGPET
jgi:hypothetical protein